MKYSELIQFEPIESVVQLRDSSDTTYAYHLLDTYVISDRMAERLDEVAFEQLQFERAADNKGLLIVGNYGTGKSHLMSVIAALAELEGSSRRLNHPRVAQAVKKIEGKFKVIRTEIGSTTMPLRDIICGYLEDHLAQMGVYYTFPSADQVRNNKDAFIEMMGSFHQVYPDQGLLLLVDELLDYLRGRREQELILDLGFLREVGEVCRNTRFRFIAGVQEMLFDNPKFQFVALQLQRVKERFEQVQIVREDIAYVVAERLLKKDERQQALIREHLQRFTPLYERLNEQMETFVSLFPIHPDYLTTFEKVTVAEKRVILKTISNAMRKLLSQEVPADQPGLISYDSYWPYIENDPSLKSLPEIREVREKTRVLKDRVQNAFTRPLYQPAALRIVNALAVHRLTTGDIYAKIGITSEELRDQLFLYVDGLPEQDSLFLRTTIETILKEIMKTASYQYISFMEENGQYYLDLHKDIAVDDLIQQKAEVLMPDQMDRYFFEAFSLLTESAKNPYVTGYRIWQHELPWWEHKVMRQGYLFFGAPNERSTAQPPRDFYIYVLQPFAPPKFKDEARPDEVFFSLKRKEEAFLRPLTLYAAAKEMAASAASGTKQLYEEKASNYFKQLTQWLRANMVHAFEVTYRGTKKSIGEWTRSLLPQASVREILDAVASSCLAPWFSEKYPEYPRFGKLASPLTQENLPIYVQDALKSIGGNRTQTGMALLNGLVLLDGERLVPHQSGYARWILELLEAKGPGQVVNRGELIERIYVTIGATDVEQTIQFRMEPELLAVVLAALVYSGDVVVTIGGTSYDAMKYEQLLRLPLSEVTDFSHLRRPSDLPMPALQALFDLFGISHGLLQPKALAHGIAEVNRQARERLDDVSAFLPLVSAGLLTWREPLLTPAEQQQYKQKLEAYRDFLDAVLIYNTPAKLHNFRFRREQVEKQQETARLLARLKKKQQRIAEFSPTVQYLLEAQQYLPLEDSWQKEVGRGLHELLEALKRDESGQGPLQLLKSLKERYQDMYMERHRKVRLSAVEDNRKKSLLADERLTALQQLATIELLPADQLKQLMARLAELKTCWNLTREDLNQRPICPHCQYRPQGEPEVRADLETIEAGMEEILEVWTGTLLRTLDTPEVRENIGLLKAEQQEQVAKLLRYRQFELPIHGQLIAAIQELLQGIERVELTLEEITEALGDGSPLTLDEMRERFEQFLLRQVGSKVPQRVRVMLRRGQKEGKR